MEAHSIPCHRRTKGAEVLLKPVDGEGTDTLGLLSGFTPDDLQTDDRIPVMLEFEDVPLSVYRCQCDNPTTERLDAYEQKLRQQHAAFVHALANMGVEAEWAETTIRIAEQAGVQMQKIRHEFTYLFNGVGLFLPGRVITQVAALGPVRAVHANPERPYLVKHAADSAPLEGPDPVSKQPTHPEHNASVPFLGVAALWSRPADQGGPIDGTGTIVAVIDTGVDYSHPAFGGTDQAPNDKVVYAASYTGEPPRDNFGHGTHVAGIIAGDLYKGTPRGDSNMQGVAPKAKLMSFKVLSGNGSGTSSNIIMAMEEAVKRGAHVLNLSLGDSQSDPKSPEAIAASNAMKAGAIVCIAAGNAGPARGTVGSPGTALEVLTVGASTDDSVTAQFAQVMVGGQVGGDPIAVRSMAGSGAISSITTTLHYVRCGQGKAASDFPPAVKGGIALIERGQVTFTDKGKAAQAAGALAAIIYNNQPGPFFGSVNEGEVAIPVLSISKEDGHRLIDLGFGDGGQSLALMQLSDQAVPQPDKLAEFSSRGPTKGAGLKPESCAPGVSVYSTTILPKMALNPGSSMADASGYTKASGTSMATPHMAGVAALMRQAHPNWDSATAKAAMVNTSLVMDGQGGVLDQGAGRIHPLLAVGAKGVLVAENNQPLHSFGIFHSGDKAPVMRFKIRDLSGADQQAYTLSVQFTQGHENLGAELSTQQLVVPANGEATLELTLVVHGEVPAGDFGGYLEAKAGWGSLHLPFYLQVEHGRHDAAQPTVMSLGQLPKM